MLHPKDFVLYSVRCGAPFAEYAAERLRAEGFTLEVRPGFPPDYEDQPTPWGRIMLGSIQVVELYDGQERLSAQLGKNEIALGRLGPANPKFPTIKAEVADKSDATVHPVLAGKLVRKVQELAEKGWAIEQSRIRNAQ